MKNFDEIFDIMEPEELDALLEGLKLEDIGPEAAERIRRRAFKAIQPKKPAKKRRAGRRAIATLATSAAVVCIALLGGYGYAEARAYSEAVEFFDEYDLDAGGLTRGEITAVYRDITSGSFTYSKTAGVIEKNISENSVEGCEIAQEAPTSDEMRELWSRVESAGLFLPDSAGEYYEFGYTEGDDGTMEESRVEKYDGPELIWSRAVAKVYLGESLTLSDGVLVWGWSEVTGNPWLGRLDDSGELLWSRAIFNGYKKEQICAAVENEDGTYAVFSRGDFTHLLLNLFSPDGKKLWVAETGIDGYGISGAARLEDGYLVRLFHQMKDPQTRLLRLDAEGSLVGEVTCGAQGESWTITDMLEYNGNVYLSAYSTPRDAAGGTREIQSALDEIARREDWSIPDEELLEITRQNYTALLLICEPESGGVRGFYQIPGSLGGGLETCRGELIWNVESVSAARLSLATNAFSLYGECRVFRYAFSPEGELVSSVRTDQYTELIK